MYIRLLIIKGDEGILVGMKIRIDVLVFKIWYYSLFLDDEFIGFI